METKTPLENFTDQIRASRSAQSLAEIGTEIVRDGTLTQMQVAYLGFLSGERMLELSKAKN